MNKPLTCESQLVAEARVLAAPGIFWITPLMVLLFLGSSAFCCYVGAVFAWFMVAHWGDGDFVVGFGGALIGEPWSFAVFMFLLAACALMAAEALARASRLWTKWKLAKQIRRTA